MSRSARKRAAVALATAAVAAFAAAIALQATGPEAGDVPLGRPPSTFGGIVICRGTLGVPGYLTADGRVVVPLNHPRWASSLDLRPARCFSSYRQARAAGYRIAAPPPGVRVVGDVYFVPVPGEFSVRCRAAERRLSFRPPCPGLVPAGATWNCGPCVRGDAFVLSGVANPPIGYSGVEGGGLHLVIAASRNPDSDPLRCIGARPAGEVRFPGGRARLVRCPKGSELHSGHLLARFTTESVSYAVSLHGPDRRNRPMLRVLLAALRA